MNSNYEQVAEIVVVLNWRLNGELVGPITRAFMKAVKGEKVRAKATLKVLAEMYLCGCVPEQEKGNGNGIRKCIPYDILKEMVSILQGHIHRVCKVHIAWRIQACRICFNHCVIG